MAFLNVKSGVGVDVRDFKAFAKALALAEPELKAKLTLELRSMGQLVADTAKGNIEPFSQTIPEGIAVRMSGLTVSVVSQVSPLSGLFELGSKGRENSESFSHPVFGNKNVWVTQPKHEFLGPAVESKADEIEAGVVRALDSAIEVAVKG